MISNHHVTAVKALILECTKNVKIAAYTVTHISDGG